MTTGAWPALPYDEWHDTLGTLHMEMQILGKVRVALSPPEPEWAHVTLSLSPRGLRTGLIPSSTGTFEVEADLIDHQVVVQVTDGPRATVALAARPIAEFYREFTAALTSVGVEVELPSVPQEVPDPIPFPEDTVHHVYDPDHAHRFWRVLTLVHPPFDAYRAAYRAKVSPVQFFWGGMDLNVLRFSGRPCAPPADADFLLRTSHDVEQISVGFWPGNAQFPEPAFYAYGYPKPEGIEQAVLAPSTAFWSDTMGEHFLRYDDVRTAPDPAALVREFLDSAYEACASRSGWASSLVGNG